VSAWSALCSDRHDPLSCESNCISTRRGSSIGTAIRRSTRGPISRTCWMRPASAGPTTSLPGPAS
jgi:hypothetical protein